MLIRIKLSSRVRCETVYTPENMYPAPQVNYILEMWIDRIALFNPDTGDDTETHPAIPDELFLYRKLSDALDTYQEHLGSSVYIRVAEPEDLASVNPTRFGSENLIWGMQKTAGTTLMASTAPSGAPLQQNDAPSAIAPKKAFSKSGYFKSRLFTLTSPDSEIITANYNSMKRNLTAFLQKYLARALSVQESETQWASRTF